MADRTPDNPTAPSPTTATVSPACHVGADRGVVAGAHDVGQGQQRGHRLVGEVGAGNLDQGAVGLRHPDELGLAAVSSPPPPKKPPWMQAVWKPASQFLQMPSLQENGEMTKSPTDSRDVGADLVDHADELVPDRAVRVVRDAAVEPQVRAADAGQDHAHDRVGRRDDGGLGTVLDRDRPLALEDGCLHDSSPRSGRARPADRDGSARGRWVGFVTASWLA